MMISKSVYDALGEVDGQLFIAKDEEKASTMRSALARMRKRGFEFRVLTVEDGTLYTTTVAGDLTRKAPGRKPGSTAPKARSYNHPGLGECLTVTSVALQDDGTIHMLVTSPSGNWHVRLEEKL